jgi:hypothetical protein
MSVKLSVFLSIIAIASGAMLYEPVTVALAPPIAKALAPTPPQPQQPPFPPADCTPVRLAMSPAEFHARLAAGLASEDRYPAGAVIVRKGCPPPGPGAEAPNGYVPYSRGANNMHMHIGDVYLPR